jgi:hypothetical protein
MPGSNPHILNSKAENEIENGKEPPPPPKHMEEDSGPRKPGKNKKEAPIRTEKPKNVATLKQQAKPRVETHGQSGAEFPAQSSSDDESVGGIPQDDQQRRRREQDQKTGRNREGKENQTQRRDAFNNENRSPNTSSAAPTGRGPQSLPAHPTSQMNTEAWNPQTTSAPNSLSQVWDASSHFGTAQQGHGRGNTQPMNTQPTGGAYSSDQSPQRPGQYTQQTSQRSARDQDRGAQHTSQAQAKGRSGTIPVGKMGAGGYF